jgi:hypothetical protein
MEVLGFLPYTALTQVYYACQRYSLEVMQMFLRRQLDKQMIGPSCRILCTTKKGNCSVSTHIEDRTRYLMFKKKGERGNSVYSMSPFV